MNVEDVLEFLEPMFLETEQEAKQSYLVLAADACMMTWHDIRVFKAEQAGSSSPPAAD